MTTEKIIAKIKITEINAGKLLVPAVKKITRRTW